MNWLNVALAALWVATVGKIVFVVVYTTGPWWRHFVGRALFGESVTLAVTLAVTLVNAYVVYPYQLQVGALLMWSIALAILYQLAALIRQRRLDHDQRDGG